VSRHGWRQELTRWLRGHRSTPQIDDVLSVDRVVQCLPDPQIVEWTRSGVQEHVVRPGHGVAVEPSGISGEELFQPLDRRAQHYIGPARLHCGNLRAHFARQVEADFVGVAVGARVRRPSVEVRVADEPELTIGV
jgi:hypothetical protein